MELCTNLQQRVLDLETTKTTQANEITSLKRRVKNLEKKNKSRTHKLKRLYKVSLSARVESSRDEESLGEYASKQGRRITDIDDDEDITLVNDQIDADAEMFDVDTLTGDEVLAEQVVAAKDVNLSVDEVTLTQALAALKSAKVHEKGDVIKEPSVPVSTVIASTKDSAATKTTATIPTPRKGIVFQEPSTTTTIISSQQPSQTNVHDKGKGKMIEPERPMKKKELIRLDEEIASKLQAEFNEEVRLAREKAEKEQEANVALTEEWDDIQAKIEADHELAQRLQAQEQEDFSNTKKATLFVQLLEKRRKHFAAKRARTKEEQTTNPSSTKKNHVYLPEEYGNLLAGSSKRAGEELEHENVKKQKVDDDKETAELKILMEVMPDEEEVVLDAIPLAVKSPSIVDWKIHKEGKKIYYQIIRADRSSKMYLVFSHMLKSFDREDLETLYKLVKAKSPYDVSISEYVVSALRTMNLYNLCIDFVKDMALPPRDQRHQYLGFEGLEYKDVDIIDFEERLGRIYGREIHRGVFTSRAWRRLFKIRGPLVHELILEFFSTFRFGEAMLDLDMARALQFQLVELGIGISSARNFLGTAPSYTSIRDPMLRLCHRLIACSIARRSQAPKKGGKHGKMISGDLLEIDMAELVDAAGSPVMVVDAPVVDKGAPVVPAPAQAPQPPARTMAQRLVRELPTYGILRPAYHIRDVGLDRGPAMPAPLQPNYCSDILYAVSIKEDTAYLCLYFTKDHMGTRINTPYPEKSIRRIQVMVIMMQSKALNKAYSLRARKLDALGKGI
ncbi:hypothetical protein Tco_0183197 [Tanacetum coccineum]